MNGCGKPGLSFSRLLCFLVSELQKNTLKNPQKNVNIIARINKLIQVATWMSLRVTTI
jgi:hypothetical protein